MKQKKMYERPQLQVVKLREMPQLLAGSGQSNAGMNVTYGEEDWTNG